MRTRSVLLLCALFMVSSVACRSKDRPDATSTTEYDVVSEGAASGVASTIGGAAGAPPPMTATNIDTTTNLAIVEGQPVPTATTGNLANTLPGTTTAPGAPVYIPPSDPSGVMRRTPPAQVPPPVVPNPRLPPPPMPAQPGPSPQPPPPTDTAAPEPAPPTDTSTTAPEEGPEEPEEEDEEPPPPPPDQTDTTTTNPGR